MEFMVIENDPEKARFYDNSGVDRIFIDLEKIGKQERQGHLNTVKSDHSIEDIKKVKQVLKKSQLLVRTNPIYEDSEHEIDRCISAGADILMLPYFKTADEVKEFVAAIRGRARVSLLLETAQAFFRIEEILEVDGIDEIHIGLNDLYLSLGLNFIFEPLISPYMPLLIKRIKSKGISVGIGGVASLDTGDIPGKYILSRFMELESERVILSRSFNKKDESQFQRDLNLLKDFVLNGDLADTSCLKNLIYKVREKLV